MKLTDLIDYKPGGVANKVIVDNKSGMVVLLAVDRNAQIPTHFANAEVIVQLLEGKCEFIVDEEIHTLTQGDYLTMSPGIPHSLKAIDPFKILVTKLNA